jgi:hypothetical protein
MLGPIVRHIDRAGSDYTVRNASGGGGRDAPSYSDTGTIRAVLEQRNSPARTTDSSGADVESDLEIRALTEGVTIREAGDSGGYPTKLVHPNGRTYQVLASHPEDSGVTVMTVVRD